jgi:hypothetical protein
VFLVYVAARWDINAASNTRNKGSWHGDVQLNLKGFCICVGLVLALVNHRWDRRVLNRIIVPVFGSLLHLLLFLLFFFLIPSFLLMNGTRCFSHACLLNSVLPLILIFKARCLNSNTY